MKRVIPTGHDVSLIEAVVRAQALDAEEGVKIARFACALAADDPGA